jgi:hypothetical protein
MDDLERMKRSPCAGREAEKERERASERERAFTGTQCMMGAVDGGLQAPHALQVVYCVSGASSVL